MTALATDLPVVTPLQNPLPSPRDRQLLAALPSAIGCARRFVRFTLERWRLPDVADAAEEIAAGLVVNAVSDSGIAVEHPSYIDLYDKHVNIVDLRLHLASAGVVIQVWDANSTTLDAAEPSHADSWNVYLPPQGGKVVWVALEIPREVLHGATRAPALPRRAGYPRAPVPPAPTRRAEPMTDSIVLGRVRDGLVRLGTAIPADERLADRNVSMEER